MGALSQLTALSTPSFPASCQLIPPWRCNKKWVVFVTAPPLALASFVAYSAYMQPKFATAGRTLQWFACDEHLQECGLCHDLFDVQQVWVQFSGQVLCDRCSQTCNPEPGQECPDFERKQP
jgi:hypothetical protein